MECLWSAKFLSVNKSPQKFLCVNKSPLKVFVCSAQICAGRLFSHGGSNFSHFMWLLNFSTFTTSPAGLAIVASHWPSKGGELHTTKPLCLYIFFWCIFSAQFWGGRGAGWGTDTRKILKVFSIGLTWLKSLSNCLQDRSGRWLYVDRWADLLCEGKWVLPWSIAQAVLTQKKSSFDSKKDSLHQDGDYWQHVEPKLGK